MSKIIFASLLMTLTWVSVRAHAVPQVGPWVCTYLPRTAVSTDANILKGLPNSDKILQINIGPQTTNSTGSIECASPILPAKYHYDNVMVISNLFKIGANLGNRPSPAAASFQVNAGLSDRPEHMTGTYQLQAGASANILMLRLGANGGLAASPGSVSGVGTLQASPADFALGGDVTFGSIQVVDLDAPAKKARRKK